VEAYLYSRKLVFDESNNRRYGLGGLGIYGSGEAPFIDSDLRSQFTGSLVHHPATLT